MSKVVIEMCAERREEVVNLINDYVSDRLEYVEYHEDSGENYAYMPREGGFDYNEGERRLREYCENHGLTFHASLIDYVLDNFTMEPAHMFKNVDTGKAFYVDGYAIGEVEIELDHFMRTKGITSEEVLHVRGDCACYIAGTTRAYMTSERAWNGVVPLASIKSFLNSNGENNG